MDMKMPIVRDPARLFAPPQMRVTRRGDGSILLDSPMPLEDYARCVGDDLEYWARQAPDRPFLQERDETGEQQAHQRNSLGTMSLPIFSTRRARSGLALFAHRRMAVARDGPRSKTTPSPLRAQPCR